jgi:Ca2+-binding EF-hand superfamily protein
MKTTRLPWIALLAISSSFAVEPPSEVKKPAGEPDAGERPQMRGKWLKTDTDGDGFISPDEFAAMERPKELAEEKRTKIFKRLDKNSDGKIGPREVPKRNNIGVRALKEVDADKDGAVVFGEFQNLESVKPLPEERQQKMFARMDRNSDGSVSAADRPTIDTKRQGLVKKWDQNSDGALDFEEFRKAKFMQDKSEAEQKARFEKMDKNKDLKIDMTDLPKPREAPPVKNP